MPHQPRGIGRPRDSKIARHLFDTPVLGFPIPLQTLNKPVLMIEMEPFLARHGYSIYVSPFGFTSLPPQIGHVPCWGQIAVLQNRQRFSVRAPQRTQRFIGAHLQFCAQVFRISCSTPPRSPDCHCPARHPCNRNRSSPCSLWLSLYACPSNKPRLCVEPTSVSLCGERHHRIQNNSGRHGSSNYGS